LREDTPAPPELVIVEVVVVDDDVSAAGWVPADEPQPTTASAPASAAAAVTGAWKCRKGTADHRVSRDAGPSGRGGRRVAKRRLTSPIL
jgi:hypothetical protein